MLKLQAVDLSKSYRGRKVVDDVELEIGQGEVVGLLGPNGAGKTTTFYILVGLTRPDSGRVLLNDDEITDLPMYLRARSGISYLPQEPSVFRQLTSEENLLAVLETLPLTPEQQRDRLEELLMQMGLETVRTSKAYTLSGGERRRLEIARSLTLQPSFILLDEPFSGIDPITVKDLQEIIRDLANSGIGVLITDHNVRETLSVTDRAYILKSGKIFRKGRPEELSNDPEVRRVYLGDHFRLNYGQKREQTRPPMAWQGLKLNLKVTQKQILTPGLVQMVSVLALNRLELREMINQEMIANPVLEEQSEEPTQTDNYSDETFLKEETEKVPEKPEANPFDEFDVGSFFNQYLDSGGDGGKSQEREVSERPSFEKFLSSPSGLSDHLQWQLSVTICSEAVKEIADSIIGNLDENGYLTASTEELAQNGKYSQDDLDDALAVVQDFDPIGVGARDLRECLLLQLKAFDPQNTLAQQIVSEHLKQVQSNQLKEIARALNRPLEVLKRALEVIKKLDPRPGLRYNKTEPRLVEPDVYFRKVDDQWQAFLNEDDMPQLRLSPTYRRLLVKDAADRDVRNYVKERFTAAVQLMKNIEQRKHTILRVCQSIIARLTVEEVGVHPSTVSRAVASKYAHTPQGVLELRSFFSESVNGPEGGDMSLLTLKRLVKKMIEEEDSSKPLTDEQIAKKLDDAGIHVTRRTVAKYREDMRIPSTHQRRVKS